jgi:hypothetical protein
MAQGSTVDPHAGWSTADTGTDAQASKRARAPIPARKMRNAKLPVLRAAEFYRRSLSLKAEYVRLSVELRDHIAEGFEKLLSIATLNELADNNFALNFLLAQALPKVPNHFSTLSFLPSFRFRERKCPQ